MRYILVIDDDQDILEICRSALSEYQVLTTNHFEGALKVLSKSPVDLVIADIILPDVFGYNIAKFINENTVGIPTILMSGFVDKEQMINSGHFHGLYFLDKPFNANELLDKVQLALNSETKS